MPRVSELCWSLLFCHVAWADFNYSVCPTYWESVSEYSQKHFDLGVYTGVELEYHPECIACLLRIALLRGPKEYFEIYTRDWYSIACPDRRCITSQKTLQQVNEDYERISDVFSVQCLKNATDYPVQMFNNLTSISGYFNGFTEGKFSTFDRNQVYPDFIVAISEDTVINKQGKEQYSWLIEFQCLFDKVRGVYYIGINAECYTPDPSDDLKKQIYDAAVEQLNVYADSKLFFEVDQRNCSYHFT